MDEIHAEARPVSPVSEEVRERAISFRVSEAVYERIAHQAREEGETPNGWCRKLIESEAAKDYGMTASDRLIFEELASLRFLFGRYLKRVLPPQEYQVWRYAVEAEPSRAAEKTLAQRRRSQRKQG